MTLKRGGRGGKWDETQLTSPPTKALQSHEVFASPANKEKGHPDLLVVCI